MQLLSPSKADSDSDDDINMSDHSRLSLMDTPNYIVKGAEVNGPESIPSIAPPWMFPSLTTLGKVAISMKADGNCLFHALADQICLDSNQAGEVRMAIVNFIADNRDVYRALLPLSDIHNGQSQEYPLNLDEFAQFDEYLHLLAKDGIWGGELEIYAAAQYFGISIVVHQDDGKVHMYNDGANDNTANIGFAKQYNHYYSAKDSVSGLFDDSNHATNTIGSEALLNGDEFAENILDNNEETDSASRYSSRPSSASEHPPSKKLPTRSGPRLWSQSETKRLLQMRDAGFCWKEIQAAFPKRTLVGIRSYWVKTMVGMLSSNIIPRLTKRRRSSGALTTTDRIIGV